MTVRLVVPFLLLPAALLGACADQQAFRRASPSRVDEEAAVARLWGRHERVVTEALAGRGLLETDLTAAFDFFERTTGIKAHTNDSHFGRLVTSDVPRDLEKWRAWYAEHKPRLYLDSTTNLVRLRD